MKTGPKKTAAELSLLRKVAELSEALRLAEKDAKYAAKLLDEALEELAEARGQS